MENLSLISKSPGSVVQGMAAWVWVPQAALLAAAVQRMSEGSGAQDIAVFALGFIVLGVVRASMEAWGARRVYRDARDIVTGLRDGVARSLAGRSPLDVARPASGLAASVIAEQAEAVVPWLARYQTARWRVMVVPPVIVAVVAWLSWSAALILVVAAPLIPVFMALVGWRAKAASEAQMLELGRMNAFLLDRLRGLATLRALAAVPHTARRLRGNAESLRMQTMRVLKIAFLSSAVLELFSALGVALTAVYTGFHVLGQLNFGAWGQRLSLAEGLFILLLAPAFFEPLRDLSAAWHDRAAGEAARDALGALADAGEPLPGANTAGRGATHASSDVMHHPTCDTSCNTDSEGTRATPSATAPNAPLFTRNLSVARTDKAPVLHFPDLDIAAGERVALWGASGSGKTLLLSLMAGLIAPRTGRITLDGTVLTNATANALRPTIGWMGQKPHVFAGSVRANVSLERKGVDVQQVNDAVANAGLTLTSGASACRSLGEGGLGLSGGEGVRLVLARLAAANGTTLMLVDEPTAHLDNATALRVIDALLRIAGPRTLIVATHDPRVAARMDRIVHLGQADAGSEGTGSESTGCQRAGCKAATPVAAAPVEAACKAAACELAACGDPA